MLSGKQILIALAIKYEGDWDQMYSAISNKEVEDLNPYIEEFNKSTCKAVTILDKEYPAILKQIYMPPFVLFYYGDLSIAYNPSKCLSIIGSRNPSSYGEKMANDLASKLSNDFVIVSGMAKGVDGIAHRSAITAGNKTIAIIGCGIDRCYPLENKDLYQSLKTNHLILSEYFGQVSPDTTHFPLRNRIISGLSDKIIVINKDKNANKGLLTFAVGYVNKNGEIVSFKLLSNDSITATYALSFSRTVLAVPNRADTNSACNRLIKEGAVLVENAADVLEEMNNTAFVGSEIQENS